MAEKWFRESGRVAVKSGGLEWKQWRQGRVEGRGEDPQSGRERQSQESPQQQ